MAVSLIANGLYFCAISNRIKRSVNSAVPPMDIQQLIDAVNTEDIEKLREFVAERESQKDSNNEQRKCKPRKSDR